MTPGDGITLGIELVRLAAIAYPEIGRLLRDVQAGAQPDLRLVDLLAERLPARSLSAAAVEAL